MPRQDDKYPTIKEQFPSDPKKALKQIEANRTGERKKGTLVLEIKGADVLQSVHQMNCRTATDFGRNRFLVALVVEEQNEEMAISLVQHAIGEAKFRVEGEEPTLEEQRNVLIFPLPGEE